MTVHIRKELWKSVNIKYFRETKCLVDYNDISVREPAVSIFPLYKNKLNEHFVLSVASLIIVNLDDIHIAPCNHP